MNQVTNRLRSAAAEERFETILKAALATFTEKGFTAARIEDVARAAGVAKGTVYLYVDSKEALLKALIGSLTAPPLGELESLVDGHRGSAEDLLRLTLATIRSEILETDRRLIVRLVLTEAHRFPEIAAYYHEHVVGRAMAFLGTIVRRGVEAGEFVDDAPARFPQLIIAPFLLAVVWQELFASLAPLDAAAMLDAHVDLLIAGMKATRP